MTDTVPADSDVVVMEDNDETTSLMSTEKIDLSEGITIPSLYSQIFTMKINYCFNFTVKDEADSD